MFSDEVLLALTRCHPVLLCCFAVLRCMIRPMMIMQREYGGQHVRCDRLCRGGPLWRQLEVQGKRQRTQTYAASTLCYYLDLAHPRAVSAQMPVPVPVPVPEPDLALDVLHILCADWSHRVSAGWKRTSKLQLSHFQYRSDSRPPALLALID